MKATIISPVLSETKPLAVCVVIPFETVEVSIALNNGVTSTNNDAKWLHKNDVRIFEKNTDKDLTVEILGSESNHTFDGEDLTVIINKVAYYEKSKIIESTNDLETKSNPELVEELISWSNDSRKLFRSRYGKGINIKLFGCMNGNFIVTTNDFEVYNGKSPEKAILQYSILDLKD